ncbi:MAG: hypothetical protein ACOYYJ_20560 [Chloroflexota bacterium]
MRPAVRSHVQGGLVMAEQTIGSTRNFVLARGFTQVGNHAALIGEDGTRCLFAEVVADPDRPEVRPQEAYQAMLSSMQPGWTLRLLQLFWPDPEPRLAFQRRVQTWQSPANEGLDILLQGLSLAVQEAPLPFSRRTVLEFVLPGGRDWRDYARALACGCAFLPSRKWRNWRAGC